LLAVRWPGREAHFNTAVQNVWIYNSALAYALMVCIRANLSFVMQLIQGDKKSLCAPDDYNTESYT
jgi:hypothetical protein